MVSGMMKKTMITLVLLGCAFLLPAQTKTTVQGRIENAENLRLYYYPKIRKQSQWQSQLQ